MEDEEHSYEALKSLEEPFTGELYVNDFPTVKTCDLVLPGQTNQHGNLFGGQALEMMDKAAAIAALRHAECDVVTARTGLDGGVSFEAPINESEIVNIEARLYEVGETSMRIQVDVYGESPQEDWDRKKCTTATFVMVAVDDDGNPTEVPPLMASVDDSAIERLMDEYEDSNVDHLRRFIEWNDE
jgi:acyl-CoA hydrolase